MKQYNILGGVDAISVTEEHPQFKEKIINPDRYYGSDLNKLVAKDCRKDMMVMNIDLIINDYNQNKLKIVESKHSREELGVGQHLLLKKLSQMGIDTYVVYGDEPYEMSKVYSYKADREILMNKQELINFLNNTK